MSDKIPDRALDAAEIRSLRYQFDAASDSLLNNMAIIGAWLACETIERTDMVKRALTNVQLDLNECRFLFSKIEPITQDAERETPRGRSDR